MSHNSDSKSAGTIKIAVVLIVTVGDCNAKSNNICNCKCNSNKDSIRSSKSKSKSNVKSDSNSNGICHDVNGLCVCLWNLNSFGVTAKYFALTVSVENIQKSYRGMILFTLYEVGYASY